MRSSIIALHTTGRLPQGRKVLDDHHLHPEIWITEAGFSTWQYDEKRQVKEFKQASTSSADRLYWYSLYDLDPSLPTVDGFHTDEREYYFGLKSYQGRPKLLYRVLEAAPSSSLKLIDWSSSGFPNKRQVENDPTYVLITGGAGFVGINLADHLLTNGHKVIIYDNLSRPGVEKNLEWLCRQHAGEDLWIELADIRNYFHIKEVVSQSKMVFHLAAQVAVTTSVEDPIHDFQVNVMGTFNVLEAIRNSPHQPPLIYTSTNKVYGDLSTMEFGQSETRYFPENPLIKENGINEGQSLSFHSPYGSSKGASDQYILDYARSYHLKAVVFRMSCIYGPHQFGTEDQGWVAHFLIQAIKGLPIHIYGDGKQVRDILFVKDLIDAFQLGWEKIESLKGEAFNIGGGPDNAISLRELLHLIEVKHQLKKDLLFGSSRTGDQVYYVSDTKKFHQAVGWSPKVPIEEGLQNLYDWLVEQHQESKVEEHLKSKLVHAYNSHSGGNGKDIGKN